MLREQRNDRQKACKKATRSVAQPAHSRVSKKRAGRQKHSGICTKQACISSHKNPCTSCCANEIGKKLSTRTALTDDWSTHCSSSQCRIRRQWPRRSPQTACVARCDPALSSCHVDTMKTGQTVCSCQTPVEKDCKLRKRTHQI